MLLFQLIYVTFYPPINNRIYRYNLRNNYNYRVPICHLNFHTRSFMPSTIQLWNSLDLEIRTSASLNTLKKQVEFKQLCRKSVSFFTTGNRKLNTFTYQITLLMQCINFRFI